MRSIVLVVVSSAALALLPTGAYAGKIFGDISLDGKPLPAGVKVKVTQSGSGSPVLPGRRQPARDTRSH